MATKTKEKIKIILKEKGYKVKELSPCNKNNVFRIIADNHTIRFYILGWNHRVGYANCYEMTVYVENSVYEYLEVNTLKAVYEYLGKML
jgi:hypothetical protein